MAEEIMEVEATEGAAINSVHNNIYSNSYVRQKTKKGSVL